MNMSADASSGLTFLSRIAGWLLLAAGLALGAMFALAATLVAGLMVAGAAIALHFAPRPQPARVKVLEARQTPEGWVVETRSAGRR